MERLGAGTTEDKPLVEEVIQTFLNFYKGLGKTPRLPKEIEDKIKSKKEAEAQLRAGVRKLDGASSGVMQQQIRGGADEPDRIGSMAGIRAS